MFVSNVVDSICMPKLRKSRPNKSHISYRPQRDRMKIVYGASRNSEIVFICCLQLFFRLKDKSNTTRTHTKEGINAHAGVILIQRKKNVSLDVLVLFSNTFRIWLSFYFPRRMSIKLCAQILWFFFFIISWIETTNEWRNGMSSLMKWTCMYEIRPISYHRLLRLKTKSLRWLHFQHFLFFHCTDWSLAPERTERIHFFCTLREHTTHAAFIERRFILTISHSYFIASLYFGSSKIYIHFHRNQSTRNTQIFSCYQFDQYNEGRTK